MSKRVKELQKQREWRSGHWLSEKPEWDECHGAAEDAWLARADLAAEEKRELVEALERIRDMPIPKADVIADAESWQMAWIAHKALQNRKKTGGDCAPRSTRRKTMANVTKEQSHRTLKQWAERERELVEENKRLRSEARNLLEHANGKFTTDDGERGWLVHDDFILNLRGALERRPAKIDASRT